MITRAQLEVMANEGLTQRQMAEALDTNPMKISMILHGKTAGDYQRHWREHHPQQARVTAKKYREAHKLEFKTWQRQHYVNVNGKFVFCKKRERPADICELCGFSAKRLDYHHWDDSKPQNGIWVCKNCHWLAEVVDAGNANKRMEEYLKLKKSIEG